MATVTEVVRSRDVAGVRRRFVGQYSGPALYAAGGDPLAPGIVGMGEIEYLSFEPATDGTNIHHLVYVHATGKVMWFSGATHAELGAVDVHTFNARFEAIGR